MEAVRTPARTFGELLERHEREIFAYVLRLSGRREDAEDLFQETFLAALEHRDRFEGRAPLRGWMAGILARKIVDHYRRTRRETLVTDAAEVCDPVASFAPFDPATPDGDLDRRQALRAIDAAIATLPELERLAVLFCDVEQLERTGVAETLGVTAGHLRVLLHRGRHKLRKALEDARLR